MEVIRGRWVFNIDLGMTPYETYGGPLWEVWKGDFCRTVIFGISRLPADSLYRLLLACSINVKSRDIDSNCLLGSLALLDSDC